MGWKQYYNNNFILKGIIFNSPTPMISSPNSHKVKPRMINGYVIIAVLYICVLHVLFRWQLSCKSYKSLVTFKSVCVCHYIYLYFMYLQGTAARSRKSYPPSLKVELSKIKRTLHHVHGEISKDNVVKYLWKNYELHKAQCKKSLMLSEVTWCHEAGHYVHKEFTFVLHI